jgi:neutral ceramidase
MAGQWKILGAWCAWLLLWGLGAGNAASAATDWKAGVARVDTTPTAPVRMSGYASRTAPSQGVAHPLFAKALALSDAQGHKVVLVTCDIISFRHPFTNRVKDRVQEKHGLAREDTVLFASHCHSGPTPVEPEGASGDNGPRREGFENNIAYTRDLERKIVDVIGEALGKMEPVSLSYGVGRAHFALNRREPTERGIRLGKNPAGPVDESVPILRVQNASGQPVAIIFGYACHNTTLRPDMLRIDPDYAGYAQDRIEADNPGAIALFVTGCAGDADPHPFGTLGMAKQHGQELGEAVKFVLDHPRWWTTLTGSLRTAETEVTIPFAGPTDRASYEKRLNDPDPGRRRHAQRMIEAIDQGKPIRAEYPHYAVQALALGDQLTLLALSGEVVVDYAIRLQRELGREGRALWVAAYANDVVGYIPSVRVLKEGGYEALDSFYGSTWPAPWSEEVESIVVKAAHDIVNQVREK